MQTGYIFNPLTPLHYVRSILMYNTIYMQPLLFVFLLNLSKPDM